MKASKRVLIIPLVCIEFLILLTLLSPSGATTATEFDYAHADRVELKFNTQRFAPRKQESHYLQRDENVPDEKLNNCTIRFKSEDVSFNNCAVLPGGDIELFWTFEDGQNIVKTAFRSNVGNSAGYVGFAYGYSEMVPPGGSRSVIAYLDASGQAAASEYEMMLKSPRGVKPKPAAGSYSDVEADYDGTYLTGRFTRGLTSPVLPTIRQGSVKFIWSVGRRPEAPDQLQQHLKRNFGEVDLSETSGGSIEGSTDSESSFGAYYIVHGTLMAVSWVVLAPLAILSARFLKQREPLWFYIHRTTMLSVIAIILAAYIMGVVRGRHEGSLTKTHLGLGTVAVGGALLQGLAGLFRPRKQSSLRVKWGLLHSNWGRLLVALAFANIIIGINLFGASRRYYYAISIVFGLLVLSGIVLEILRRLRKSNGSTPREKSSLEEDAPLKS